jgi:hypothetical protein
MTPAQLPENAAVSQSADASKAYEQQMREVGVKSGVP